ncbi:MAG: hypothetical protein ACRD16_09495 [Thermoanaerobaculia bacterium]
MNFRRSAFLALAALAVGGTAIAQNLMDNPNFDTNLLLWSTSGGSAEFDSRDADGLTTSGSAKITNNLSAAESGQGILGNPCIGVSPGDHYSFGGKFFVPTGQASAIDSPALQYFSGTTCTGALGGTSPNSPATPGVWQTVSSDNVTIPDGVQSIRLAAFLSTGNDPSPPLVGYFDDAFLIKGSITAPCVADDTTLCLHGGRYRVNVYWRTHSDYGDGHGTVLTDDSADYWFFDPTNVELILKVKDACVDPFNHFWVFIAGLTNVEVTVTVIDTHTGVVRTYTNPLDRSYVTALDTNAFATCP